MNLPLRPAFPQRPQRRRQEDRIAQILELDRENLFQAMNSRRKVQIVKLLINASPQHQLIVPPGLHDPSFFQYHNQVRMQNRREPVRNADGRAALGINSSSAACTARSDSVSSALVASSSTRMGAFLRTARAMAMRWRWPPESDTPFSPMTVSKPWGFCMMNS